MSDSENNQQKGDAFEDASLREICARLEEGRELVLEYSRRSLVHRVQCPTLIEPKKPITGGRSGRLITTDIFLEYTVGKRRPCSRAVVFECKNHQGGVNVAPMAKFAYDLLDIRARDGMADTVGCMIGAGSYAAGAKKIAFAEEMALVLFDCKVEGTQWGPLTEDTLPPWTTVVPGFTGAVAFKGKEFEFCSPGELLVKVGEFLDFEAIVAER